MAKLLSLVGRAWSFALRHLKGEHFIQHDCQSVPRMLKEAAEALRGKGELSYEINDVDSSQLLPEHAKGSDAGGDEGYSTQCTPEPATGRGRGPENTCTEKRQEEVLVGTRRGSVGTRVD